MLSIMEPLPTMAAFQDPLSTPVEDTNCKEESPEPGPNPFDSLPIEIRQDIARRLESDVDLSKLRLVCRSWYDSIDADGCSFWRGRFLEAFDNPPLGTLDNVAYRELYQARRECLANAPVFALGRSQQEHAYLDVVRDLIVDSWPSGGAGPEEQSLNVKQIEFLALQSSTLLCNIFAPSPRGGRRGGDQAKSPTPLLVTVRVILAPLILSLRTPEIHAFDFPQSQRVVYSGRRQRPIFVGQGVSEVDMLWVLHQINFWKYHMVREEECTLYRAFAELDERNRPQLWNRATSPDGEHNSPNIKIGRTWKTCFAFIGQEQLFDLRAGINVDDLTQDEFEFEATDVAFPEWELIVNGKAAVETWPKAFEDCLHSLVPPAGSPRNITRAHGGPMDDNWIPAFTPQRLVCRESDRFEDTDVADMFHADGWLTALPPQNGIPGFARVTMMKFKIDAGGSIRDPWAYEGVMLPGRQMILGRWWQPFVPESEAMSGPFIMWCVGDGREFWDQNTNRMDLD